MSQGRRFSSEKEGAIVIGGGFAGLSAASHLASKGLDVRLLEKHETLGGRARSFSDRGFFFDMGPSWYWMPDVFERYFRTLGSQVEDHYELHRLDPSYRVFFEEGSIDIPAGKAEVAKRFEELEAGSGAELHRFLQDAAEKYRIGMGDLVRKPSLSIFEFLKPSVVRGLLSMDLFRSLSSHIRKKFHHPWIRKILEFPVLFLGSDAGRIPALYSLMNHADIGLGTWYPMGGMNQVVRGMEDLAAGSGVRIHKGEEVLRIRPESKMGGMKVETKEATYSSDNVVASIDGAFADRELLGASYARYGSKYWESRSMAPSVLLFFLGVDDEIDGLQHHNLFFDRPFEDHLENIRAEKEWPEDPLFYVCAPSRTDPSVAPEGKENLFILVPVAPGLENDKKEEDRIYDEVMGRLEERIGKPIREQVSVKHRYGPDDLKEDHHAFKGNAYGLANTLRQTAILKPSIKSKKVKGLYFAGQTTVPGPGVPPSLISGELAAELLAKERRG